MINRESEEEEDRERKGGENLQRIDEWS